MRARPAKIRPMGDTASSMLLLDAAGTIQDFVNVFISVYILVILVYIITSWIRLPYSPTLNRIQRFLFDVCDPYLRIFRRIVPPLGPLDLSPMLAVIVLIVARELLNSLLDQL
jgi:YggT family protein